MSQENKINASQTESLIENSMDILRKLLYRFFRPKDRFVSKEMTEDAYKTNIRIREELLRDDKKHFEHILSFCLCILLFLFSLLLKYGQYCSDTYFDELSFLSYYRKNPDSAILFFVLFVVIFIAQCTYFSFSRHSQLSCLDGYIYAYERFQLRKDIDEDLYKSSIQMSYKYLDQYYKETREQASRGFSITVGIAIAGAAIIAIGIISMFFNATLAAYVTTASGVIIEFISSIFFHLYNKTIQSMGNYHNKLILSQNISIALKIADSVEGTDQNAVKIEMIKALTSDINQHINSNKPVD